ncbi:MAG: 1-acyl-sn-glycerol-3-phosphate acyltransferase [Polyangiales bacterium]
MTKKVLGNDPFASNNTDESAGKPAAKASARPSAKASKRPTAKPSKAPKESAAPRPSKRPKKNEPDDDLIIAAVPKVPAEARHLSEPSQLELESVEPTREASGASAQAEPASAVESVETTSEIAARATIEAPKDSDEERAAIDEAGAEAAVATDASARDEESAAPVEQEPEGSIEERIRDLESQLDVLLASAGRDRQRGQPAPTPAATANEEATQNSTTIHVHVADEEREPTSDGAIAEPAASESDPADIASSEYYARQWGRVALRDRAEDVDEFGLDREFVHKTQPVVDALYSRWWRVETSGVENVPDAGRVILCANHAGAVPYDGLMLAAALRKEHPAHRTLRWLADDFVFHFPFMGVALNRLGAVRACQENAERLLRSSNVVGVFPEGVKGVSKPFGERYQLQRFGRGGHIKLALRTRTPIVPVAIVGSEETHPMLPTGPIAKLFNMQFLPVTPTFPWLGALGLIPLPSKWSITFLEPIPVDGYDKDAADDELLVGRLNEKVRTAIQDELARRVRSRQSAWR